MGLSRDKIRSLLSKARNESFCNKTIKYNVKFKLEAQTIGLVYVSLMRSGSRVSITQK